MNHYLLTISNWFGDTQIMTRYLARADSIGKAKQAYHVVQREAGAVDVTWGGGKHFLELYDGHCTDIENVKELTQSEYAVLSRHLPEWDTSQV